MFCRELQCEYCTSFNPGDDTWAAIKVFRDGEARYLERGFPTEEEAEACALRHRDEDLKGWGNV